MDFEKIKKSKDENADYICAEIENVIKTCGKRDPGSEGEGIATAHMADELKKYADEVKTEDFKLNPESFYGWIPISITLMLLAVVAYFFVPIAALFLLLAALAVMVGQFVLYGQIIDMLFKEKTSHNVTAVKKPSGEVKQRIFFNGHTDAAWEWTCNYYFGGKVMTWQVVSGFVGIIYLFAIIVFALIKNGAGYVLASSDILYMGIASFVFVPVWISLYGLSNSKIVVDGANDNLTGCYIGIAVLKALKENNITLENTEVGVILTGSEEAGLRGAKAWSKAHKKDYKDVDTYIVAFDTLHEAKFLAVNALDLNMTVKSDVQLGKLFKKAADNVGAACNPTGSVPVGATDSAAFTQGGFRSIGVTAMDHDLKDYYHTRKDTYDNLDKECLATAFEVSVECLDLLEKGEMPSAK